jgi:hypothetical protein
LWPVAGVADWIRGRPGRHRSGAGKGAGRGRGRGRGPVAGLGRGA